MDELLLLEEAVTSLHLDTEKESDTGHHSRTTTERPYLDDPATTTEYMGMTYSVIVQCTDCVVFPRVA